MPDKITTLKLVDNTDVFPNIKDENIPNTIMRIADLSKYLNQLKSINITGDVVSTTITSYVATFTTADISTLNVSGISQFEGEATFGHNVHVDGNIVVNGIDNIVDKGGNKIVNIGTFDPTSDNPAGQKSIMDAIIEADLNARFSRINSFNLDGAFSNLTSAYSGKFHLLRKTYFYWDRHYIFIGIFSLSNVTEIDYSQWLNDVFEHCASIDFQQAFAYDYDLRKISATYSLRKVSDLNQAFERCSSLKTIKLRDYPVSFDISASTRFEENDLVEILNNLMDLTGKTTQTLTLGATNLAKLTDTEKAIATNKNWTLA